jgi:hypothetical protein
MATGFLFYGSSIFVPTMSPFQFVLNSITAGLFYGVSKSMSYRSALAIVLIWYVVSTLLAVHNWWFFIISLCYIVGVSSSVFVYMALVKRPLFNGMIRRTATISVLTGMFNGAVIVLLYAIQSTFAGVRMATVVYYTFDNFQLGCLIGLGLGIGIEIAEYFLRLQQFQKLIDGAGTV